MRLHRWLVFSPLLGVLILSGSNLHAAALGATGQEPARATRQEGSTKSIVLNAWEAFPTGSDPLFQNYYDFLTTLEKRSGGKIKTKYIGGPEAIPPFEALQPLSQGVIDFAHTGGPYYAGQVPIAQAEFILAGDERIVFRQSGLLELFNKAFTEKANVIYLGWLRHNDPYVLVGNKKIASDLKGLNIRGHAGLRPFIEALGGNMISLPWPEVYPALQRGVIDLTVSPFQGLQAARQHEVSKYIHYPPFGAARNAVMMNVNTYNRLSPEHQKLVRDVFKEYEDRARDMLADLTKKAEAVYAQKLIRVDLPADQAKKFRDLAFESAISMLLKQAPKYGKEAAQKLRWAKKKLRQ